MNQRTITSFIILIVPILFLGCSKIIPPVTSITEADKKFLQIAQEEYELPLIVRTLQNTKYIYLPMEEQMINIKAIGQGPPPSSQFEEVPSLLYVKSAFTEGQITIQYDIDTLRKYGGRASYSSVYSQKFAKIQNAVLSTLSRAYFDVDKVPGDVTYKDPARQHQHEEFVNAHVKTDRVPDFFVLIMADIEKGVKTEGTFYFQDIKKAMSMPPAISPDEYQKRYLNEVIGDPNIIGDKKGSHIDYREILWPEFLGRQLDHRIKFKYQQSSFKPTIEGQEEILSIVSDLVAIYDYQNFQTVKLINLATEEETFIQKSQLPPAESASSSLSVFRF